MKRCFKCEIEKPFAEFYEHPAMTDGHLGKCKSCTKADVREHRAGNLDRIRAYDRKRGALLHRLELSRKYQKEHPNRHRAANQKYLERNPDKYAANIVVNNAVRDGRLFKEPCEVCLNPVVEAHHDDYSKPLSVRWLCALHHKAHHKAVRETKRAENRLKP